MTGMGPSVRSPTLRRPEDDGPELVVTPGKGSIHRKRGQARGPQRGTLTGDHGTQKGSRERIEPRGCPGTPPLSTTLTTLPVPRGRPTSMETPIVRCPYFPNPRRGLPIPVPFVEDKRPRSVSRLFPDSFRPEGVEETPCLRCPVGVRTPIGEDRLPNSKEGRPTTGH